ncbi:MAG: hypothetical protein A2015_08710 [Spirochaetes bacterium GWF1_31_7]|nr:MAG: hypothetical protein A2Y30_06950 [Spirochaetes bacterium GWE1_32_154]OHD48002.1 MAG: hypothetical protein A2015_08710 [Spirochaetes bacterium GWF1_31_7]OHD78847.1 MAG: hypothetical protein A2355_06370 [Spirochaetes bacterium RIFOXYB1_FULL_32_8]HBD92787.1 hypothetical protein [Spirochaetia bacterium]HBI36427.1 hypothetical protein [Spirochaetia bacterium]
MAEKDKIVEKYNYLLKLFKKNRIILGRVMKRYVTLKRNYINLRALSNKTVKDLSNKIIEDKYQIVFNSKKHIVNVSQEFLDEIEMTKEELSQSFYIDTLFSNFFPTLDKSQKEIPIKPFHFPIMIKNYFIENEHIHPYVHFEFFGKIKYITERKDYFYFLNIRDMTSEIELNYIQNTDSVIKSLSISNLFLQQAKKNIEVHKIILIFLICSLIEEYNKETSDHLKRIQEITGFISDECLRMGFIDEPGYDKGEYVKDINYTSVLHDIGKMGVPNYLLSKETELTSDEKKIITTHTVIGANYIKKIIDFLSADPNYSSYIHFLNIPYDICLYHHERWDGKGYPEGLAGKNIPVSARIVAVADTYDAIRGNRSYTVPRTHKEALEIIRKESGKQFDPDIVSAFVNVSDLLEDVEY